MPGTLCSAHSTEFETPLLVARTTKLFDYYDNGNDHS
jgi:hypothetical protein